ncbi:MAG TPA: hypothetical protein VG722_10440 [Tepidisphaeraceae bacterium]|nr:hypothetical protein [Tepidisphaeraceae bacterium]
MVLSRIGKIALLSAMVMGSAVYADTLNLPGGLLPDVETPNLDVSYVSSTGALDVHNDGDFIPPTDIDSLAYVGGSDTVFGTYQISAVIDNSGHLSSSASNTVIIYGATTGGYDGAPIFPSSLVLLLSGTLTNVGFASGSAGATSGNIINFTFNVTGGVYSNIFGPQGGITLTVSSPTPTPASFSADFTGLSGSSFADNFAISVPTPAAISGGAALLGLMATAVRRRSICNRD